MLFENRREAGKQLADALSEYEETPNVVVVGLANNGMAVAGIIAKQLKTALDMLVVKKIGFPEHPEASIGAVRPDGKHTVHNSWLYYPPVTQQYVAEQQKELTQLIRTKYKSLTGKTKPTNFKGKKVILVDEGAATGSTIKAATEWVHEQEPQRLILALPFIMPDLLDEMKDFIDDTAVLHKPLFMHNIHQFYNDFSQTTDDDVKKILKEAKGA